MAIDFGLKRSGIALSDDSNTFAFGKETVESKQLMGYLQKCVVSENVSTIVLGEPKRLNTQDSHITQNVHLLFVALNEKFPTLKVELYDERFTSKMASQSLAQMGHSKAMRADKGLIDEVSATILLQSYLSHLSK